MNNLLEVKLKYTREDRKGRRGGRNLRINNSTSAEKIDSLIDNLRSIIAYYRDESQIMKGYLIDVHYNDIIAKSNRIERLLKPSGKRANDAVVGARFSDEPQGEEKHIITYYVDCKTVDNTIKSLEEVKQYINSMLGGTATAENFNEPKNELSYDGYSSKSTIRDLIVDCSVVESLEVPSVNSEEKRENILITFFKTEQRLEDVLRIINIDRMYYQYSLYGDDTISVPWELFIEIKKRVPYMVSMISDDDA